MGKVERREGDNKEESNSIQVGYFPHVRALCPAWWHLLQIRALFVGGGFEPTAEEAVAVKEAAAEEDVMPPDEEVPAGHAVADDRTTAAEDRGVSG